MHPPRPFTPPWADALCAAIDASPEYREAGRGWTWPVALVLDARPDLGYPADVAVVLALGAGRCTGAHVADAAAPEAAAPFALRAGYDDWKRVVRGELDVVTAVLKGQVRVTGSLATLMLHARSARVLVGVAREVPASFPDEA